MKNYLNASLFVLLVLTYYFASSFYCIAVDPRLHQIETNAWSSVINKMQIGFGIDKKEVNNPSLDYITAEVIIKNMSKTTCIFLRSGPYQGVRFISKSINGTETEAIGDPKSDGLSNFVIRIQPNTEHHVLFKIKREQLLRFAANSDFAQVTIRESESDTAVPLSPFNLEVGLNLIN